MEPVPWGTLEGRILAKELVDVVSSTLFRRYLPKPPVNIPQLFRQVAANIEQIAGPPEDCYRGYRSPVRSYFTGLLIKKAELMSTLGDTDFLAVEPWTTCIGQQLNIEALSDPVTGCQSVPIALKHTFTSDVSATMPLPVLIGGSVLGWLLPLLWLRVLKGNPVSVIHHNNCRPIVCRCYLNKLTS